MTKFALEAMGKAMRAELAISGVDVALLNPGPFQTGFNDSMAASMWEWFGEDSTSAAAGEIFKMVGDAITADQMDPAEVADAMVALVEADSTEETNFVPPVLADLVKGS